jgi:choline kinase
MDKLSIIIPAAGPGRRMKSYGPKALIHINGKTVIQRQLDILQKVYPSAEVIVVLGFEADKVRKELPYTVHTVVNNNYETTNVAYSLMLGMCAAKTEKILIVYGDLVFNMDTFAVISKEGPVPTLSDESTVIIDHKSQFDRSEVGVMVINNEVSRFSYGLPTKWAQIVLLTGQETDIFRKEVKPQFRRKLFGFEVLNEVLNKGGIIKATEPDKMKIAEIDTSKDIEVAKKII